MKFANIFKSSSKENEFQGSVFYVIDKRTGDVMDEMGLGRSSSQNGWDKIEEYALQLSDKMRGKQAPFIPNWNIVAYPCDDIRKAYRVSESRNKVATFIRSRKPAASIDLRIAFYATENELEYTRDKKDYTWMDARWKTWIAQQKQLEKEEWQKSDIIFINSMFADQNTPSESDLRKVRTFFLENKDNVELLERILTQILTNASKNRRIQLFAQVDPILSETDLYEENQYTTLDDFFDIHPDKMKPIHILSAELLEDTLAQRAASTQANSSSVATLQKDIYRVRRFLYRYHKAKGQLSDEEHVFEMEEEVDTVLANWRVRISQIGAATAPNPTPERVPAVYSGNTHPVNIQVLDIPEQLNNSITEITENSETSQTNPPEVPQITQSEINKIITDSFSLLEKGHPLREQIIRYLNIPQVTRAQVEWAASQKFITPVSLVEDGTLVSAIIETDFFKNEIGTDLQYINPETIDKTLQLVCLSYDIFCRRELCNTSALLTELTNQYTFSTIKSDIELANRYKYLYLTCQIRKRCYESVSLKVSELKKIEYDKKREDELSEIEKTLTILVQENRTPSLRTTTWESLTHFLSTWKEDGCTLQALMQILADKIQTVPTHELIDRLLSHCLNIHDRDEALAHIRSITYSKHHLTLTEYFVLGLYHLQAVAQNKLLEQEDKKRREWGSVFDKLNQIKQPWADEYIAETHTQLQQNSSELSKRAKISHWAESVMQYRFCETDDIPFDDLEENLSFQPNSSPVVSPQDKSAPDRQHSIWAALPTAEESKVKQAIRTVSSCIPLIDIEEEEDNLHPDMDSVEEYIKFPGGKGYILNGVRIFSKKDYQTISQAFSFVLWRQSKTGEQLTAYKRKLSLLKEKMEAESIQWPDSFLNIYNGIINN